MSDRGARAPYGIAVVHGACGGIGSALVAHLINDQKFNTVVATCRNAAHMDHIAGAGGDAVALVEMDATDEASVHSAARQVASLNLPISLMVCCIGMLHSADSKPERRLMDVSANQMVESFRVNAIAPTLILKAFFPLLVRSDSPVIANLSAKVGSIADNRLGGWYSYRASKCALNMLTTTAALELARRNPKAVCVAVHPGTVATTLSRPFTARLPTGQTREPSVAAKQIVGVLEQLSVADSGKFMAWNGDEIPW